MKRLILMGTMAFLAGCEVGAEGTVTVNSNPKLTVVKLSEVDGCTIYRFYDNGYSRYFVRCQGTVTTSSAVGCGEDCVRIEEIPTLIKNKK